MVRTRKQLVMDRASLERLTLEELKDEAARYRLPITGTSSTLIDTIMTHLERHGPMAEMLDLAAPRQQPGAVPKTAKAAPARTGPQTPTEADPMQQMLLVMQGQQQQLTKILQLLVDQQAEVSRQREAPTATLDRVLSRDSPSDETGRRSTESWSTGSAVQALAHQIPEFAGSEENNVHAWVKRVDKVAQVHGATDGATLLAASSKLTKSARRWFDVQGDTAVESWVGLRAEMIKIFDRKIPFFRSMQRIEARKWLPAKESFDEYALEKLSLMHRLDLPEDDRIQLLVSGIQQMSLRATALSLSAGSVDSFLEKMRTITQGTMEVERKAAPSSSQAKMDSSCKNCGKKGHSHQQCRADATCFYCKERGHRRFDCPALRKKESRTAAKVTSASTVAATCRDLDPADANEVAAVDEVGSQLVVDNPLIQVSLSRTTEKLLAMLDTGSPVSFVKASAYKKYIDPSGSEIASVETNLRNLSNEKLQILGIISLKLKIEKLNSKEFSVDLHVLNSESFQGDIIIGREFLYKNKLTLVYNPAAKDIEQKINLFSFLPLCVDEQRTDDLNQIISDNNIDFDFKVKQQLQNLILNVRNRDIVPVDDDYAVQVNVKDTSVFAYAPRRFALQERKQMREITDDLLRRGVIQPSASPYCARVLLVKKKNGQPRLCVDLRPLNSRVHKQKYPFPIIEDCLASLGEKKIFTLLDLRDSFYQIKIHKDSRKYLSFATPEGQFEFKRLPFGFCESPAEFQKRLIQILSPLIRQDKVLVYIDDVLIASKTIRENLEVLEEVLVLLKMYGFELNYQKCKFLRKQVEFLGYVISGEGVTISPRHTEAVKNYRQPRDKLQLQRFLGLANYFRKFVKDYAQKAKPLQNLLKKGRITILIRHAYSLSKK
ncbi:uncharacterized protein LOC114939131 [Nylanderia fulva]|uniref:uncharacterized protein LOC114939131 n=1 Tax=Nylanderia fulva TaxID=613905 RepID=UPI0010FB77BA|nr:uncharacterized protein LOC114939131 [Nylanderia fulva]